MTCVRPLLPSPLPLLLPPSQGDTAPEHVALQVDEKALTDAAGHELQLGRIISGVHLLLEAQVPAEPPAAGRMQMVAGAKARAAAALGTGEAEFEAMFRKEELRSTSWRRAIGEVPPRRPACPAAVPFSSPRGSAGGGVCFLGVGASKEPPKTGGSGKGR